MRSISNDPRVSAGVGHSTGIVGAYTLNSSAYCASVPGNSICYKSGCHGSTLEAAQNERAVFFNDRLFHLSV